MTTPDTAKREPRPLVFWLAILVTTFTLAGFGLAAAMMLRGPPYRLEAVRLLLQFLLITGVGGLLVAGIGALRDREAKKDEDRKDQEARTAARIAALQALDQQLGKTYRELKTVKRRLRSHVIEAKRDREGRPGPPYAFAAEALRESMADLLAAQIRAEDIRDHITVRSDLFDASRLVRIQTLLRYATRFFHDVHEDLERGRVETVGEVSRTGSGWSNIDSLINGRSFPADLPKEIKTALENYLKANMSMIAQYKAIQEIDALRAKDGAKRRRFRAVADDCFALASAEIRQEIALKSGAQELDDPYITHRSYASTARTLAAAAVGT